jgi:hypothetical protein
MTRQMPYEPLPASVLLGVELAGGVAKHFINSRTFAPLAVLCAVQCAELHPAANGGISARRKEHLCDSERAVAGDGSERRIANAWLIVRVDVCTCSEKQPDDLQMSLSGRIVEGREGKIVEVVRTATRCKECLNSSDIATLGCPVKVIA